jgi:hypothetical protein
MFYVVKALLTVAVLLMRMERADGETFWMAEVG